MRRLSLGGLLIGVHIVVVLTAVALVAAAAVSRLRHLSDQQALAQVALAGANAAQAISRSGEEALAAARLLGERPILARLLEQRDTTGLESFLEQFRRTSHLEGCSVSLDGAVIARSGRPYPPPDGGQAGGDRFFLRELEGSPLIMGASSVMRSAPGATVTTFLQLDGGFADGIASQVGLPVTILARHEAPAGRVGQRARVIEEVLASERPASERLGGEGVYVGIVPLRDPSGAVVGVVETELPLAGVAAALGDLVSSLILLAILVTVAAGLLSILVSRWLVRPIRALTRAAARIGGGDLATPVTPAPGAEMETLSASMEEMRGRLLQLTVELRRKQTEAEAVLVGIAEGVFAVDRERSIRYMNPQAAALLGVQAGEVIGRFCGDVLNPQGTGGTRPCEESCPILHARFGGSSRAAERLLLSGGGRPTVVITSAAPDTLEPRLHGGHAEDGWQFQVMRDETEVEATRRLRDVVLANISHEFRTPLTAQLASIELLRDRLAAMEAPEVLTLVLSLERGTLRLTQLIDNLLESVRIEAGRHSIRRGQVALDEVIEEAVEMTRPLIAQRSQALTVDLPYPFPAVTGDAPRLTQVFVNLLANANKFAPSGSSIAIGGATAPSEVTVWVEDEGPGLGSVPQGAFFARFVRAPAQDEDEEEPEQGGMGLGLSIVKAIVERHGGRVEARKASPGVTGTRMCVILPVERADEGSGR
ncbi:MAG TPA: ATP-binding protein [Candidatus Polarisedimenticolia bacterium]|jgi:signal transduction histidine kinase